MFGRGCPATGRMMHVFDKTTHRCRCGRWERGFKPKTEPVRPRAECQICERQQALDAAGCLGHHGYRRPGWGHITGDCVGVGHRPYPATDALVAYLAAVRNHVETCRKRLKAVPRFASLPWAYDAYEDHKRVKRTLTVFRDGRTDPEPEVRYVVPSFEELVRREIARLENEIKFAEADERRVVARIAKAEEDKA